MRSLTGMLNRFSVVVFLAGSLASTLPFAMAYVCLSIFGGLESHWLLGASVLSCIFVLYGSLACVFHAIRNRVRVFHDERVVGHLDDPRWNVSKEERYNTSIPHGMFYSMEDADELRALGFDDAVNKNNDWVREHGVRRYQKTTMWYDRAGG